LDNVALALIRAQDQAEALFAEIVQRGLIAPGKLESELTAEIHALAQSRFGVRRHWHKRIARAGPNTLLGYHDASIDRRIQDDDIVYLDLGPVFESWEADFGRSYALGPDPHKQRLVHDIGAAFQLGKRHFQETPELSAGALYDFVVALAAPLGWEFGAATAGHLIGRFPHEQAPRSGPRLSICHGNPLPLRAPDAQGRTRHWILEIHFVDRARQFGGFFEELLTIDTGTR
jgi:hypothetical protein